MSLLLTALKKEAEKKAPHNIHFNHDLSLDFDVEPHRSLDLNSDVVMDSYLDLTLDPDYFNEDVALHSQKFSPQKTHSVSTTLLKRIKHSNTHQQHEKIISYFLIGTLCSLIILPNALSFYFAMKISQHNIYLPQNDSSVLNIKVNKK